MLHCTDGLKEIGEVHRFNQFLSGLPAIPPHCYLFEKLQCVVMEGEEGKTWMN